MLYMIKSYKNEAEFNVMAGREEAAFNAQHPGASSDKYWQVAGFKVRDDGQLTVLWVRKTAAV